MSLSRIDLDGIGSPLALAEKIHELLPDLAPDFDLDALCAAFDIHSINRVETSAYEAAIVMDVLKAQGAILLAKGRRRERERFSIAHELGHFLIETHRPVPGQPLSCALNDLSHTDTKAADRHKRIEAEANRFAAALLMPAAKVRKAMTAREPNLDEIVSLARNFAVSKEAMARVYVTASRADIAVLILQHGRILRVYRSAEFPWIQVPIGQPVPNGSIAAGSNHEPGERTEIEECEPETWLSARACADVEVMTEQVLGQAGGFAMVLLRVERADA
ncbi:ImmA/IrrE family metallo-endopeptidase [Novosphingobium sp. NDB2Meth1]|uniref:ImmA/IrrE family metallo-endopeptidase n=1 Tax=Novosphingobium sp. NDB2Meth1 TaxID=1892847 RepID=UPI000930E4F2|nr:ImmA/IrrE family metallo-endopeptidase [Novosphingobium sp. NDB2Meth1]